MPATQATTIAERREMIRLVEEGHTYASAADQVGVSFWTVRKWIRQAKRHGIESLASCYGRPRAGPLSGLDPIIRYVVLRLKRQHPKWGAEYVLKKLSEKRSLSGHQLPSATTIWRYWRSFGDRLFRKRDRKSPHQIPPWCVANGRQGIDGNSRSWVSELQPGPR